MNFVSWLIIGVLILPAIIFYTVRAAVEEGTFNALVKYDECKKLKEMNDN
jgi:hypothetical protein